MRLYKVFNKLTGQAPNKYQKAGEGMRLYYEGI